MHTIVELCCGGADDTFHAETDRNRNTRKVGDIFLCPRRTKSSRIAPPLQHSALSFRLYLSIEIRSILPKMSSILRGARTKRRGHPSLSDGGKQIKPWLRPHGGTVTNAINTARTGSVQGMVMVQRRPTVKQTPVAKESTAQIVTPYAQSHGSSVAMEEGRLSTKLNPVY